MSIAIGTIVTMLGILGLIGWWSDFLVLVKGSLPLLLICAGAIAIIAGASELKDEEEAKTAQK